MNNYVAEGQILIGDAILNFELPTPLFLALSKHLKKTDSTKLYTYHSEAIINLLRSMLDDEQRPPTHRQLAYASNISAVLNVELTSSILTSSEDCSAFLEKYSDKYQDFKLENKELYTINKKYIAQARKIQKWTIVAELILLKVSKQEVSERLGLTVATIEKHQTNLNKWCLTSMKDNTYNIVMMLVDLLEHNENMIKYSYIDLEDLLRDTKDH